MRTGIGHRKETVADAKERDLDTINFRSEPLALADLAGPRYGLKLSGHSVGLSGTFRRDPKRVVE